MRSARGVEWPSRAKTTAIIWIVNNTEKKEVCVFDWTQSQRFIEAVEKLATSLDQSPESEPVIRDYRIRQDQEDLAEDLALWRNSALALMSSSHYAPDVGEMNQYLGRVLKRYRQLRDVQRRELDDKEYSF